MTLDVTQAVLIATGATALVMLGCWFRQRSTGDAGLVDIAWAAMTGLIALFYAWTLPGDPLTRWLAGGLGAAWGLRLAVYLYVRNRGEPEDGRYKAMREEWGEDAQRNLLLFFQAQTLFAVIFSLPYLGAIYHAERPPAIWLVVGVLIWVVAVAGEALADYQLMRFKQRPDSAGRTCREGLWRYTRHPNYFFEFFHWFAYVAIGIANPWWLLTLSGPVLMYVFLMRLTGIPYTERQAIKSRGEDYRRYQEETNMFFPGPPRNVEQESGR